MSARLISRHWQGRAALLPTCLLTLLGLRLTLDGLGGLRPLTWPFAVVLGFSLASSLVLVWQVIGGARAVARAGRDLLASSAGMMAVAATVTLFLNAEVTHWAARNAPPPDLPAPPEPLPVQNGTARIATDLGFHTLARVNSTLAAHPNLHRIDLHSDGGSIPAARAIARRIGMAGLDTNASGLCASACTLVFMAGRRRSLSPDGQLGFHAYRLHRFDPLQSVAEEQHRDRDWLRRRGVSDTFLARAFATPPDRIWVPDRTELRAAGLLTD